MQDIEEIDKASHAESRKPALDCKTLLTFIKNNRSGVGETIEALYLLNNQFFINFLNNNEDKIDLVCKDSLIMSIIYLIENNKHYLHDVMPKLSSNYNLHSHSLNVMIYALHIGKLLNYSYGKLFKLGEAALLHDIGEKKTDYILAKDVNLDMQELELIKKHIQYGIEILKHNNINDPYVISAIEQHHEKYDGSGYPNGLRSDAIDDFACIIGVCDVFDALTIDRPHRKKYSTFESLKLMMQDASMKHKYNHTYIKLLLV